MAFGLFVFGCGILGKSVVLSHFLLGGHILPGRLRFHQGRVAGGSDNEGLPVAGLG